MTADNSNEIKWHTLMCNGYKFTVPTRYENPAYLGQGAQSVVVRMTDTVANTTVAIKKRLEPFDNPFLAKRAYRELRLLQHLSHSICPVVRLRGVFTPDQVQDSFQTLYIVLDYFEWNFKEYLEKVPPFNEPQIQRLVYDLLRSLKYIHSGGIIHRDLKPDNIGLDLTGNLAILDFDLARPAIDGAQTRYVVTRWWRAPEVILKMEKYDEKVDMWSAGCIMAELILRKPLFCGASNLDQLRKIFQVIGTPELAVLEQICARAEFMKLSLGVDRVFWETLPQILGWPRYPKVDLATLFKISPDGIDLLDRLLRFDPHSRPTAKEALEHPFLREFHDESDEPSASPIVDQHSDGDYTLAKWNSIILDFVKNFVAPDYINSTPIIDEDQTHASEN